MRILYISQYFPPEIGATQTRAFEMARNLRAFGHQVTMLTEFPNHPAGVIPASYKGKVFERTELEGIDVIRVWVKASRKKNFRSRIAFYLSFMGMSVLAGLFLARGKYDVIYATSPPLFAGGAALILSFLRRVKMVFEVRDIWPEAAVQLGELRNRRAIQLATALEEACYKWSKAIVVVTKGIEDQLLKRGYSEGKVNLIPNGANVCLYRPLTEDPALRQDLGISPDQFVVIFTGLHGLAHGMETILQAANILKGHTDIVFLLVGDGPRKETLMEMAAKNKLENVIFHPFVPEEQLPAYLAIANVGLHTSPKITLSKMTLPVKMFSYMACEIPVLLCIEGEAADLVLKAGAGVVVPPEDPKALAKAVLELKGNPEQCLTYGRNGRAFVTAHYSRQTLAKQLAELLEISVAGVF
jgi:glycosyltransferase involved in cell wall biosynthesis